MMIDLTCLDESWSNLSSTIVQAAYTHLGNCCLLLDNMHQLQIMTSYCCLVGDLQSFFKSRKIKEGLEMW